jgi:hypothetical protein
MFSFTGIALATSNTLSVSSDVVIYAFEQKPVNNPKSTYLLEKVLGEY